MDERPIYVFSYDLTYLGREFPASKEPQTVWWYDTRIGYQLSRMDLSNPAGTYQEVRLDQVPQIKAYLILMGVEI